MAKIKISEDNLQAAIVLYVHKVHPYTRYCFWAVPNGGQRNKLEAAKMKRTGTVAGVHDLHFMWKGQFYTFELKVGSNKLTDHQEAYKAAITKQGAICYTIRTLEEFVMVFVKIVNEKLIYIGANPATEGNQFPSVK